MKVWDSNADWDDPQDVWMVHSEQPDGTDFTPDGILELGYPLFDQRADSLECYYPNAEDSGDTMHDVVSGFDGTYDGVTLDAAGVLGRRAVSYDATTSSHAHTPNNMDLNSDTFTVALWFYYPPSAAVDDNGVILGCDPDNDSPESSQSNGWAVRFNGSTDDIELIFWDGGSITDTAVGPTLNAGEWHYIAARGSTTTGTLDVYFEDGTHTTTTLSGGRGTGPSRLFMLGGDGGSYVSGRTCHIRGYTRELVDDDLDILALTETPTGYIETAVK